MPRRWVVFWVLFCASPTRVAVLSDNWPDDRQTARSHARARPAPPLESANDLLWFTKRPAKSVACSESAWRNVNYTTVPGNMLPPLGSVLDRPPWESTTELSIRCHWEDADDKNRQPSITFEVLSQHRDVLHLHIEEAMAIQSLRPSLNRRDEHLGKGFLVWSPCLRIFKKKIDLFTPSFYTFFLSANAARTSFTHLTRQLANKTLGPVYFSLYRTLYTTNYFSFLFFSL